MSHTVAAVIAEFNPFHEGHKYILDRARAATQADFVMVVMSPDFVQRGCPAIDDKYTRTRQALANGADCVIELPVSFATGAAKTFAESSVTLLSSLGVVDYLCFGSECGDIETLQLLANTLSCETPEFSSAVRTAMKNGCSYPGAIDEGLRTAFPDRPELIEAYSSPNNRLGIEYLKALQALNRSANATETNCTKKLPVPVTIARTLPFSATSARAARFDASLPGMCSNDFFQVLTARLIGKTPEDLTVYEDVSLDLAGRICQASKTAGSYDELAEAVKTRAFTRTRIDRALTHIMLDIREADMKLSVENGYASYVRILGFRKAFEPVIRSIMQCYEGKAIMKQSEITDLANDRDLQLYKTNEHASELYRRIRSIKYPDGAYIDHSDGLISSKEAATAEGSRGIIVVP